VRAPSLVTLRDIQRNAVETGISLPVGPTGESRGEVRLPDVSKDSKSGFWKRNVSILALRGELEGRAPLLETPKDMKIGSGNSVFFNRGPVGGQWRGFL